MFAVYAAEQQYHHDSRTREKERLIRAAIRDRSAAAPTLRNTVAPRPRAAVATTRTDRAAWPRPIGLRVPEDAVICCAVA